jgi:adenylate cyclase
MLWLRRIRKHSPLIAPALMLLVGTAISIQNPPFLQVFRSKLFDLYQQLQPREYQPAPVKIVDIDEESLKRLGQFPWPRNRMAQMLVKLFEGGARVVAFDIVFAEADRTSPEQVLPVWLDLPKLDLDSLPEEWRQFSQAIMQTVPDHDVVFAETIKEIGGFAPQYGVVVGFAFNSIPGTGMPQRKAGFAFLGDDPRPFIPRYPGAAKNLLPIEEAASGVGSFSLVPESDNIVRRVPIVMQGPDGEIYPALAAEALRVYQGASSYILKSSGANMEESFGESTGLNHIRIGDRIVPVDASGGLWVHYTRDAPERVLPAWRIFEPDFDPKQVEGHILFVGTSAAGLKDLRSTPLNPAAAGVEVHAQATEQILLGHYLQRPDWADGAEKLFMLLLGVALIVVTTRYGAAVGATVGIVFITIAAALSWYLYAEARLLTDPIYPTLVALLVYLASSLLSYLSTEAEKRRVRSAFSQYLSPALVEQLAQEPERLRLGGETKNMTFLFCDVRGFTSISESFKNNPQGLTGLINRFLTPMTNAILARRGTIDKYMGDCIMAFWNAPLDDQDHVQHGCESALAMLRELDLLNERLAAEAAAEGRRHVPLAIGIGVNTGTCVVGNMGSDQRFDYSVLGDAVNLASRLEGQSKNYGVPIVLGEETAASLPDYPLLELDRIAVKGKEEAVHIYTVMGDQGLKNDPAFQALSTVHAEMLRAYRAQRWQAAREALSACREKDARLVDLYDLYEERIGYYMESPPGPEWDGVFVATEK